jgi:hypothetical protein
MQEEHVPVVLHSEVHLAKHTSVLAARVVVVKQPHELSFRHQASCVVECHLPQRMQFSHYPLNATIILQTRLKNGKSGVEEIMIALALPKVSGEP